ncbi:BTAD domain-containing putative transcriptional regulator [Actinomadura fulvescens]|uniref:Bacterial transcriptional activator domain-containing protein n=1 Tax=Actinomadura fulvescens TaxID=46160 RepID=A0ABN3PUI0_9ACTN
MTTGRQRDGGSLELMPSVRCHLDGLEVPLTDGMRSLVITVALEGDGLSRRALQNRMWPDLESCGAAKRLRQLLWRVKRETGDRLLTATSGCVRLAETVSVDLHSAERRAREAVNGETPAYIDPAEWSFLGEELLSSWPDENVWEAQDRWNRLRLLALERLAERALEGGDVPSAIELASMAVSVDEFNEIPYRVMASAYLARGDLASSWRVFTKFQQLLRREMGLEPSAAFRALIEHRGVARSA